jgi:hypothetical protein
MYIWIITSLKVKYLYFCSVRRVARYVGIDVIRLLTHRDVLAERPFTRLAQLSGFILLFSVT